MATIRFYPHKPKGKSKIYLRLSIKRGIDFRLSTGQTILDATKWKNHYPHGKTTELRNLRRSLEDLNRYLLDIISEVEQSTTKSINDITSNWVKSKIKSFFNDTPITDENLLVPYAFQYTENLSTSTYKRKGRRVRYKQNTIDKYHNFTKQLEGYQNHIRRKIKISDINEKWADEFLDYLATEKSLSINTRGRYAKRLKTIISSAEKAGKKVDPGYKNIEGFEDETIVTTLSFEEIDKIIASQMPNKRLEIAKDWLIIGCYTAQRVSDFYRMNKSMIVLENNIYWIVFKQFKTGQRVKIPIHYKVMGILEKYKLDFPPNFSQDEHSNRTQLSSLMKDVCEASGINEKVRGRYNGVIGRYPKYKLIQNHTCRRSFATNFYGRPDWPTPMIMKITGHLNEINFLKYIDQEDDYLSNRAAENFAKMKLEDEEKEKQNEAQKSDLKVI
ncbi:phage integrase SAM-like domain-containing protein [Arenibacter lacus]|uniref:phage integrase SAM-like domain-containing protein n=1 Tax=Arenibacter lacus TaxID=2608629 RepID=UPI00123D9EDE|nr:phage integrase SAM-like domain-containing protein [Arenibacter lacus]